MSDTLNISVNNPLSRDFTMKSLLKFACPSIVMMMFMGLYTIGDTIVISRFVNTNALSALNIVTPVINVIVGLGAMLATGGSAIIAKKMGEGNHERASQDFTLIVIAGVILGGLVSLIGCLFIDKIIYALGASDILFPYCKKYLLIILLFTPASIMQVLFQNLIVTAGKPGFGMVLSICAGAFNVLLDYIFIVPMGMGIAGSALGTGIGYLIPTVIGIIFFLRNKGTLCFKNPILNMQVLWKCNSNGFSEFVSQIATALTTFLFNIIMMKLLGEDGVAAITIIIYTQFLLTTLYIGFTMGVAPIISYNYGSKEYEKLKKIFRICLCFIGLVSVLIFLISMTFGSQLVSIFSPKGTDVYQIAREGFLIFPISFLFCGINIFASATFTALSNGIVSAIISSLRIFVFISIALLVLPSIYGVLGIWLAVPLAELLSLFISLYFIFKHKKDYHYL
ncbi:MATE family efflux transporter [Amedibacillus sp. YH-ame10]